MPAGPGRPETELQARALAAYMVYGPDKVSISQARDILGLARYAHYKHRDFARELIAELVRLREQLRGEK
jgi:hypothetical protein